MIFVIIYRHFDNNKYNLFFSFSNLAFDNKICIQHCNVTATYKATRLQNVEFRTALSMKSSFFNYSFSKYL